VENGSLFLHFTKGDDVMKKNIAVFIYATLFGLVACVANTNTNAAEDPNYFLTATIVPFYTHVPSPTVVGPPANVMVALNMGGGGAGFSANIYAQEVNTGQTFTTFMSAGMHTAPLLPTSPPVFLAIQAPGTYVFYARLSNAPTEYHYGSTECRVPTECTGTPLVAVDVVPGETYYVYIADRKALLPDNDKRGLPVTVPWVKLEQ
jgi:hypothetical protein